MIFQIVTLIALLIMFVYFLRNRSSSRTKAYKKIFLIIIVLGAIISVLLPGLPQSVAQFVGVGRGADLVFYMVSVVVVFMLLNGYMKDRESERRTATLARKVAILEANLNELRSKARH